jgi:hypothetical protein
VSSPTGELKQISVSGISKARLLWLFRNFTILDFSVLTKKQQEMIVRMWQAAPGGRSTGASLDLIGCIDGFNPQLVNAPPKSAEAAQPPTPAKLVGSAVQRPKTVDLPPKPSVSPNFADSPRIVQLQKAAKRPEEPVVSAAKAAAKVSDAKGPEEAKPSATPQRRRAPVRMLFGVSAGWTPVAVFLLAGAVYVGQIFLRPEPPTAKAPVLKSPMTASPQAANRELPPQPLPQITPALPASQQASASQRPKEHRAVDIKDAAAPAQAAAATAVPEVKISEVIPLPRIAARAVPAAAAPVATSTAIKAPALPAHVSPAAATHMPQAMAHREAIEPAKPPRAAISVTPRARPEVLLRVRVDANGHTQNVEVIDGNRNKAAAAVAAAKRWSFHPCSGSDRCEHVLKFTNDGDTSSLQRID